jgi:hypothetical protein
MNAYDAGQGVRLLCPITVNGVPTDPGTLSLTIHPPPGTGPDIVVTLAGGDVLRDSAGTYHYDLIVTAGGVWRYAWVATTPAAAAQGAFLVRSPLP